MIKVSHSKQVLFEERVIDEFNKCIRLGYDKADAFKQARIMLEGIYTGGCYLGFQYDFGLACSKLTNLYISMF